METDFFYSTNLGYGNKTVKYPCDVKTETEMKEINDFLKESNNMFYTKTTYTEYPYIPITVKPMTIKIKKLNKNLPDLKPAHIGEWIDLYCAKDVTLKKGEFKLIDLGVCIKLPEGFEGWLAPRSSTCKKFGIIQANSIGIIDNTYCGDNDKWMFPAVAIRDTEIKEGDRICQFRIMPIQPKFEIEYIDKMEDGDRGGIGSTGHKEL